MDTLHSSSFLKTLDPIADRIFFKQIIALKIKFWRKLDRTASANALKVYLIHKNFGLWKSSIKYSSK